MIWSHRRFLGALVTTVVMALSAVPDAGEARDDASGTDPVEIAIALPLSGEEQPLGQSTLEGIELAVNEQMAKPGAPRILLETYDEESNVDSARRIAHEIVRSKAVCVLGSVFSYLSLVEGPIFADRGIAALTTATSDLVTENPTTFRVNIKNSDQGDLLATYLSRVLRQHRIAAIVVDDGYGRTLETGFESGAKRLGLDVAYYPFKTLTEAEKVAETVAKDATRPAVALLMLDAPAAIVLPVLRRHGMAGPILGGDSVGGDLFGSRLAAEAEERRRPGSLTDGVYATSPMMLDSASADVVAFAERYRARYGRDPSWAAAAGYDAGSLAVASVRAGADAGKSDPTAQRAGVLGFLRSLDSPDQALPGLLGPLWFDADRGRAQAIRMGRFSGTRFESAPLQIVPVTRPSGDEIASGAVFPMAPGRFGRLQRVVYTGVFLNEISHVDIARSSFGADFYIWLRYAKDAGIDSIDPAEIDFPNMLSGSFNGARPAEQGEMPDGTIYRLWRVQGEFRNDFDLHSFPFDRQRLELPFYNARGASDRIVYVLDRRSGMGGTPAGAETREPPPIASPGAFSGLTQWEPQGGMERRENLVTNSSLGDPRRIGTQSYRELSGFIATFDVKRRALATVAKSLMPLLLMTLIIYATLHFPPVLIKEKVTVAVSGALSGAVLLTAINSQLGGIGYTIAIEYAFFVFFGLTTFSIVAALMAEHYRHNKRQQMAIATERGTRLVFLLAIFGLLAGAWWIAAAPGGTT